MIDAVYRAESRCVLATLIRLLGGFELAEEALHAAFAAAVEQSPREGMPANPRARLISTGRFKAIDAMRRRARFDASQVDEVEALFASGDLVVDVCRRAVRGPARSVPLAGRPVLFALVGALAEAWPADVPRDRLVARAFEARAANESHRTRLRVELGRLRAALRPLARIEATRRGFALVPVGGRAVVVLAPADAGTQAARAWRMPAGRRLRETGPRRRPRRRRGHHLPRPATQRPSSISPRAVSVRVPMGPARREGRRRRRHAGAPTCRRTAAGGQASRGPAAFRCA